MASVTETTQTTQQTQQENSESWKIAKFNTEKNIIFSIADTTFMKPKEKLIDGKKELSMAVLNSRIRGSLYIETPWVRAPFGLSRYEKDGKVTWSIQISLGKSNDTSEEAIRNNNDIDAFHSYARDLQEKLIEYSMENSEILYKKKITNREIIVEKMNMLLKPGNVKDGVAYPDTMTIKIYADKNGEPGKDKDGFNVFKVFKTSMETPEPYETFEQLQEIVKKGNIKIIAQAKLYCVSNKTGISLTGQQSIVPISNHVPKPTGFAFADIPIQFGVNSPSVSKPAAAPVAVLKPAAESNETPNSDAEDAEEGEDGEEYEEDEGEDV